jgi:hypothetical protein
MPIKYKKDEPTLHKLDEEQEDDAGFNGIFAVKTIPNKNQYQRVKQDLDDAYDDETNSSCLSKFKKSMIGFKGYVSLFLN